MEFPIYSNLQDEASLFLQNTTLWVWRRHTSPNQNMSQPFSSLHRISHCQLLFCHVLALPQIGFPIRVLVHSDELNKAEEKTTLKMLFLYYKAMFQINVIQYYWNGIETVIMRKVRTWLKFLILVLQFNSVLVCNTLKKGTTESFKILGPVLLHTHKHLLPPFSPVSQS